MLLITAAEAADILGVTLQTVYDYASRGRLTPRHAPSHYRHAYDHAEVETFSLSRLRRIHHEPHPYWATTEEAVAVLRVSYSNVPLMMLSGRLPDETAAKWAPLCAPAPARGHSQRSRHALGRCG